MSLRFQDDSLLLALCDVDLSLRVEQLLSPVSFCLHLKLQLPLKIISVKISFVVFVRLTSTSRFAGWKDCTSNLVHSTPQFYINVIRNRFIC